MPTNGATPLHFAAIPLGRHSLNSSFVARSHPPLTTRPILTPAQGCEWYANGNEYEGGFDAGKRSGHGTMLYAGGDVYIGQWRRDMKHGRGTLRFAAGGVYQGAFRVGAMEGQGVYCFADGARYEGQYKAGKKEGRGVYQFADGSTYEGEYRNGRMDGFGAYQYSDGKTEVGRYDCGIDVGAAVRWSADRRQAWRLWDGQLIEEISLDMADRIARAIGHASAVERRMEAMEQYASRDGPSTVGNASHRSVRSRASAASGASRKSGKRADPLLDGTAITGFVDRGPLNEMQAMVQAGAPGLVQCV
jgi:hypothetical protein